MIAEFGAILPWQEAGWQQLLALHRRDRLPHALILSGMEGTGIRLFAQAFAHLLLCQAPRSALACGECSACALNRAASHPDLLVLEAEKPGAAIKVDAVRELVAFGHETAQQGGYRVVVLCPAEAMNLNAANSLLKTLEEPGARTLLLLASFAPSAVLPTIRSRCQIMPMAAPESVVSRAWLQAHLEAVEGLELLLGMAPRQPLLALRQESAVDDMRKVAESLVELCGGQGEPLQVAAQWLSLDPQLLMGWLYQWLSAACLSAGREAPVSDVADRLLNNWLTHSPVSALLAVLDELVLLRRQLLSGANPNRQLLWERVALLLHSG